MCSVWKALWYIYISPLSYRFNAKLNDANFIGDDNKYFSFIERQGNSVFDVLENNIKVS